jgi:putative hydrolase of the HAD superfamily
MVRSAPEPVEAVVFDWGGTLTPWHEVDIAESYRIYARGYDPNHGEDVAAALLAADNRAWSRGRAPHFRSTTLEALIEEAGLQPSGPRHDRAVRALLEFWEPHTYADPDALPLLTELRARPVRVGVLSNTVWPRGYHDEVFRRDGLLGLIDAAVYSSEIDVVKPHPEAFAAVLEALGGVPPERAVFVGDRLYEDVHGAQQAGMRAVLLPHSRPPASQLVDVDVTPDGVVHRLLDLLDLLDRPGPFDDPGDRAGT